MGVIEHWNRILAWLAEHAPATRAVLRPRYDALPELRVPIDLQLWWSVYGGTEDGRFAEILPPFYTPLGADRAFVLRDTHASKPVDASEAGSPISGFHPEWLPIAFDGTGDVLAVDLRPGVLRGCVVEWDQERNEMVKPEWTSIVEMFDQVATALETRSAVGHCFPEVNSAGELGWRTS
ncbi:SMI1/KNR4 family protein [Lentzea waywayandensis]|uniref:SMI1/KNR4 family protein n=1 Tax=Lentzea waywayandensis TaxID=84724 RepID=UPI0015A64D31|nr:SMI1/KNR4 family protein [Lentzea waywayandensis]